MGRGCALVLSLLAAFGLFAPGNYARAADPVFCSKYANDADKASNSPSSSNAAFRA